MKQHLPYFLLLLGLLILAALFFQLDHLQQRSRYAAPQVSVLAEGLLNPVGIAALPDGALLVAEEGSGEDDTSAGVSLVTPAGAVGRFISGLPSGRGSGDLSGVPLVALSPGGDRIYLAHFGAGHLLVHPLPAQGLSLGPPLAREDLGTAMRPLNNVRLINPFDITFDPDGTPVVTDASGNGVARETAGGTTHFFHRFDRLEQSQVFFILMGIGNGLCSAFPIDSTGAEATLFGKIHDIGSGIGFLLMFTMPFLLLRFFTGNENLGIRIFLVGVQVFVLGISVFLLALAPAGENGLSIYVGLWQRLYLASYYVLFILLARKMVVENAHRRKKDT